MLDIRFVRENPDAVKENIRKKFQDAKLPLVDEVIALDAEYRAAIGEASDLRANRNKLSKQIGALMGQAKKDPSKAAEAEEIKKQVTAQADRLKELEAKETELQAKIQEIMYTIPQMIDPSVPIGPDDSHNVEVQRFGEPVVPDYPIPYHVDIMESFDGIDLAVLGLGNKDKTAVRLVVRDIALVADEVVHRQHQLILHGEVIQRTGVGDGVHSLDGGNSGIKVCGVGFIAHDDVGLAVRAADDAFRRGSCLGRCGSGSALAGGGGRVCGGAAGGQQHGAAQNNGDQFFHRSGSPFIITLWLFSSRMGIACPILL